MMMMKSFHIPLSLALLASFGSIGGRVLASTTYSSAVFYKVTNASVECNQTGDELFLATISHDAMVNASFSHHGNVGNWKNGRKARNPNANANSATNNANGNGNGNGNTRALEFQKEEEELELQDTEAEVVIELEQEFLDLMVGGAGSEASSVGHRRLACDCQILCVTTRQDYWCNCCECCNGRRRLGASQGWSYDGGRKLSSTDLAVKAHDVAHAAIQLLKDADSASLPSCLYKPDFEVEVYIEEDSNTGNNGRGVSSNANGNSNGNANGNGNGNSNGNSS